MFAFSFLIFAILSTVYPLWFNLVWDCVLPRPGCLFSFPGEGSFQLLCLQRCSLSLSSLFFFFWDPYNVNVNILDVISSLLNCPRFSFLFFFFFCQLQWFLLLCLLDHWSSPLYYHFWYMFSFSDYSVFFRSICYFFRISNSLLTLTLFIQSSPKSFDHLSNHNFKLFIGYIYYLLFT